MNALGLGLALLFATGALALPLGRARLAVWVNALGTTAGAGCLLAVAFQALVGQAPLTTPLPLHLPGAAALLEVDPLSAFFLLLVSCLAIPCAWFGAGYLAAHDANKNLGVVSGCFAWLVLALALVVTARDGLTFLFGWEAMTVTSFLLVGFGHEREEVRRASLQYLIAAHLSGACLLAMFALLGQGPRGLEFAGFEAAAGQAPLVFVLAVLGFATKLGLFPVHVWLPEAHPAAPTHVSALMSGVMIKMGAYGLLRVLTWFPEPRAGFGTALIVLGSATAIGGILNAIGQRDLKRVLAYSSIENMGIATVGIGLAVLGGAFGAQSMAVLALAGTLLHLLSHMLTKGALFLGAGAIVHATGTRDAERLGGLLQRMPRTGYAFGLAALAICALPPLCGFVGEWLLLSAALRGTFALPTSAAVATVIGLLGIVAAGGLALVAFTRLFGIVWLGAPRSPAAAQAREAPLALCLPPLALVLTCLVLGVLPTVAVRVVEEAAWQIATELQIARQGAEIRAALAPLHPLGIALGVLVGLIAALAGARRLLRRKDERRDVPTWGCGYAQPGPRMQYTATSYGQPLVELFQGVLAPETEAHPPEGLFPAEARFSTHVRDRLLRQVYVPLFACGERLLAPVRRFQDGRLNKYLLQIVIVLVVFLVWMVAES